MPLKLIPPRKDKTPYYSVRGTYLGRYVDRSTKTSQRALAKKLLSKWEGEIERGEFTERGEATFASAALAYMETGGERLHLKRLIEHFAATPLRAIDQAAIDAAATELYPDAGAATRNRQVYTPVSAVLRHAGAGFELKRPRGAQGAQRVTWLWPEQAERLIAAAADVDVEFGILIVVLLYTGERLSEALSLDCHHVRLAEAYAYLPDSKTDEPRAIHLPPITVAALANHPRGLRRPGRVFRFTKSGHLYKLWRTALEMAKIELPSRHGFHVLSHTWATWMRRYGGLDTKGLVATGRWKDLKSAHRYEHAVQSEESRRADLLPTPVENPWKKVGGEE